MKMGGVYIVTGKKEGKQCLMRASTLSGAMAMADRLIEDLYLGVKIEVFEGQLPLFEEGYYESR